MAPDISCILQSILKTYRLSLTGCHGIAHWARVYENGMKLAMETGANVEVVQLFAVLHDSQRWDDGWDAEHGPRAAVFAREQRGVLFDLPQDNFDLLYQACAGHTHGNTHHDVTVRTCWDADRLDLGRVGITPLPGRLCTDAARRPEFINWAFERSINDYVPDFVNQDWGIDLVARR